MGIILDTSVLIAGERLCTGEESSLAL